MLSIESEFLLRQNQLEEEKRQKNNDLALLKKHTEACKVKVSSLESEIAALITNQAAALNQIQEEALSPTREQEANAAEMVSTLEVQHHSINIIQAKQLEIAAAQVACRESESVIQAKQSEVAATLAMCKTSDAKVAQLNGELKKKVADWIELKSQMKRRS